MKLTLPLFPLLVATTACATSEQDVVAPVSSAAPAQAAAPIDARAENQRLLTFLDQAFDESLALSPESMTGLGIKTDYDKLDDYTDAGAAKELALAEKQLAAMKASFDPARLSPTGKLNYRLFEYAVETQKRQDRWRSHRFPVSTNGSPAGSIPVFLINQHRIDTVADAEAYISRLKAVERVMGEVSIRVRKQADMGIVPPKLVFAPARADTKKVLVGAPFDRGPDSTLLADFRKKVNALDAPAETKQRLFAEAGTALAGPFKRGYTTLLGAVDAIEPKATGNNGAWSLPDGEAFYADRLRYSTTTDLSADQIHQIGLAEVVRLRAEMETIKDQVGFKGSLEQFFDHVRTSPEFKYSNDEAGRAQYLKDANTYIAQVMAAAPKYFHRLPKAPLEVRPVEKFRESTAAIAFYNQPTPDGSRPGIFYVNLADMTQVLTPMVEDTSYHEAAPGHHFQIARQQELEGVPKFRRFGFFGAYVEGWGLYAERLGKEMGFFQKPISDFGRLNGELWRAVRLVVDTGLHSKRWTREQAIDYFRQNTMLSEHDRVKEVERYINNPGQATSYKIGQLKILELRQKAQTVLGSRFDIRDFHEVVLGNGALPLDVLEEQVDAYIASRKA